MATPMNFIEDLRRALEGALPLMERAATEEARRNAAPTGLPKSNEQLEQLRQTQALLKRTE